MLFGKYWGYGADENKKQKTPEAAKHVNTNVLTLNWGLFCCDITWGVPHQGLNAFFI